MIPTPLLDDLIRRALAEDLQGGDLTTEAVVDPDAYAIAEAKAKSPLVVCGGDVFARVFYAVDPSARVEALADDGTSVEPGTVIWQVEGSAHSLLLAERTALNLAQRMTGTATLTRKFVDALPAGSKTRIVDTRKTTPGLRALERYAVRAGGGRNHRDSLGAGVMIKDNHIAAAGGIRKAVDRARAYAPHTCRIECEVDTHDQLEEALGAGADIIMLDNFDDAEVKRAVDQVGGRAIVEVSGGITVERVRVLAESGVDVISVGALTHSAPAADISLGLRLTEERS